MLRWAGPMTLGAVGHRLWITPATVTNAIDRLEAAGLCRRVSHPTDARATLVRDHRQGRAPVRPRGREAQRRTVRHASGSTRSELDQLVGLIEKIRAAEGDIVAVKRPKPA